MQSLEGSLKLCNVHHIRKLNLPIITPNNAMIHDVKEAQMMIYMKSLLFLMIVDLRSLCH